MEKPGLEQAVMVWGAGALILHIVRNINFAKYRTKDSVKAAQKPNFSGVLESISGWTVKAIMFLILLSNTYQLFFSGIQTGRVVYCFGIGISVLYFVFFAGLTAGVKASIPEENRVEEGLFGK
jgi:hypothetical protein